MTMVRASTLVDESVSPLKCNITQKSRTIAPVTGDLFSLLLADAVTSKKRSCKTIETSSPSRKSFLVPSKIPPQKLMLILAGEEVIFSGRTAHLKGFEPSSSIKTAEELKEQQDVCASVKKTDQANGAQRLGKRMPEVISSEYDVYGGAEKSSLGVILKVEFLKVKKQK